MSRLLTAGPGSRDRGPVGSAAVARWPGAAPPGHHCL